MRWWEEEGCACANYESCSAPICPRDPESMQSGIYYPDEDICTARGHGKGHIYHKLLYIQRRIRKKAVNKYTFFTVEMLLKRRQVRVGVEGLSPDRYEQSPE